MINRKIRTDTGTSIINKFEGEINIKAILNHVFVLKIVISQFGTFKSTTK